jgi:hypothetical protein
VLEWLTSVNPSTNHNIAAGKREQKTGDWFLESDDFGSWMKSHGFLWLHGIRECIAAFLKGKRLISAVQPDAVRRFCGMKI